MEDALRPADKTACSCTLAQPGVDSFENEFIGELFIRTPPRTPLQHEIPSLLLYVKAN